jgi:hypothetical protein
MLCVRDGWAEAPEASRREAADHAREALEAGENDPGVVANAAFVLARLGEDIGAMIGLVGRALALNPSYARGWCVSSNLRIFAGQPDLAIKHLETSLPEPAQAYGSAPIPDMGRLDEMRAILARLRAITPPVVPSDLPFRNPEDRELFLSGLRRAAGEVT